MLHIRHHLLIPSDSRSILFCVLRFTWWRNRKSEIKLTAHRALRSKLLTHCIKTGVLKSLWYWAGSADSLHSGCQWQLWTGRCRMADIILSAWHYPGRVSIMHLCACLIYSKATQLQTIYTRPAATQMQGVRGKKEGINLCWEKSSKWLAFPFLCVIYFITVSMADLFDRSQLVIIMMLVLGKPTIMVALWLWCYTLTQRPLHRIHIYNEPAVTRKPHLALSGLVAWARSLKEA